MNDTERRRYECLIRVSKFGTDNAADFPAGVAHDRFQEIADIVDEVEGKAAEQESGFGESAQQYAVKSTARETLREQMSDISRTANSMEYAFDGISDKFYFKRNLSDASLLAKGRAFVTEATPYLADFIAYGMPATFITELTAACDAFEASFSATAGATAEHVEATAGTADAIRRGMVAKRVLNGVVRNKYAGDPGKLAAWESAQHVEKAPEKDKPVPPVPPTP